MKAYGDEGCLWVILFSTIGLLSALAILIAFSPDNKEGTRRKLKSICRWLMNERAEESEVPL